MGDQKVTRHVIRCSLILGYVQLVELLKI